MLTEAVRNTQPSAENGSKRPPKAKKDRGQGGLRRLDLLGP
jgi:hypothetical protein